MNNINNTQAVALAGIGLLLVGGFLWMHGRAKGRSENTPLVVQTNVTNVSVHNESSIIHNAPVGSGAIVEEDEEDAPLPEKPEQLSVFAKWAGKAVPFLASAKSLWG